MEMLFNASVWAAAVRVATPLLLAAFGCLLCDKAGITNLAIDGFITVGCFICVAVVDQCGGNVWLGMLGAVAGTALYSAIFGLAVVRFRANHIIASIAMNLLSGGLTTFLMAAVFNTQGLYRLSNIQKLPLFHLDFLDGIPFVNAFLNNQSYVVLLTIALIFVMRFLLRRTEYGLKVTALGQSEGAAKSAGISPARIRWSVVLLSGAFCGLAGALPLHHHPLGVLGGHGGGARLHRLYRRRLRRLQPHRRGARHPALRLRGRHRHPGGAARHRHPLVDHLDAALRAGPRGPHDQLRLHQAPAGRPVPSAPPLGWEPQSIIKEGFYVQGYFDRP